MKRLKIFFKAVKNSLINPHFYKEVKSKNFWASLFYLYTLLVLVSLAYTIFFIIPFVSLISQTSKITQTIKTEAYNAFPDAMILNVKNGELDINVPQPFFYKNLLVIDTKASIEDYLKYKQDAPILITKTAIVYPQNSRQEIFFLKDIQQSFTLDKSTYLQFITKLEPYLSYFQPLLILGILLTILLAPFVIASFMLSEKIISLLIFCGIFYLILKILRKSYAYIEIYKIAMHASTLPIIFYSVLGIFNHSPSIPFGYSLLLALLMGIIINRLWMKNS